jgi:hypothetical protein
MALMRLVDFFERFDSARDKLKVLTSIPKQGDPETSLIWHNSMKTLYGYFEGTRYLDGFRGVQFPSFQKRRKDVRVFCGFCYVPLDLIRDIRFAEKAYELKTQKVNKDGN